MTPTSRADLTPAQRLRSIFSGSVGNLVEWYDWYVYAAFSLYFAEVFFPGGDRTSQLLKTAAIFAVGFLMRPLGGWLLGRYAAPPGRRQALSAQLRWPHGGRARSRGRHAVSCRRRHQRRAAQRTHRHVRRRRRQTGGEYHPVRR